MQINQNISLPKVMFQVHSTPNQIQSHMRSEKSKVNPIIYAERLKLTKHIHSCIQNFRRNRKNNFTKPLKKHIDLQQRRERSNFTQLSPQKIKQIDISFHFSLESLHNEHSSQKRQKLIDQCQQQRYQNRRITSFTRKLSSKLKLKSEENIQLDHEIGQDMQSKFHKFKQPNANPKRDQENFYIQSLTRACLIKTKVGKKQKFQLHSTFLGGWQQKKQQFQSTALWKAQ